MDFKPEKYIAKAAKGETELEKEAWEPILARANYPFNAFPDQQITFEVVSLDEEGKKKVSSYIQKEKINFIADGVLTAEIETQPFVNLDNWKEARNTQIKIRNNTLDLSLFLPKGARFFFCPTAVDIKTGGALSSENIACVIGDINNLRGILIGLHEIGHLRDNERLAKMGKNSLIKAGEYSSQAEELRAERSASAFAISVLKPFLKEDPILKKDVLALLKNHALQNYYSSITEKVNAREALKREYAKNIVDADIYGDEYQIWDDWQKWRNTPAYQKWKSENPDIDKWDEFGAWREWVEQNKYDYWKDIETP